MAPVHAWSSDLCTREETTFFSCVTDQEIISVCNTKKLTQYRSGRVGAIAVRYPEKDTREPVFFFSEAHAHRYNEAHLRFEAGDKMYVIFDRWNGADLSGSKDTRTRGVAIFNKAAFPKNDETAVFKRELLVEEKICKKSAGFNPNASPGKMQIEDFIYGP